MTTGRRLCLFAATAMVFACAGDDEGDATAPHVALAIADQEDAVCGMLVREQSAPRAQAVHRDGSRFFFCSLGDMLVHLAAPSPHGAAEAIFVEVMQSDEDPMTSHADPHPWRLAREASYVVGIPREGIMGAPVLAYADRDAAMSVASGHPGASVLDYEGLERWWGQRQDG